MLVILLFLIIHWYLSLFMQTFLQHRYAAHGAFSMSNFWERFFYIAAYITQGSSCAYLLLPAGGFWCFPFIF